MVGLSDLTDIVRLINTAALFVLFLPVNKRARHPVFQIHSSILKFCFFFIVMASEQLELVLLLQ